MTNKEGIYCPYIPDIPEPSQVSHKQKFEAKVGYKQRKKLEELQKFLDDNSITLEEYLRQNMITDEEKEYVDKMWINAIYKNLDT